MNTVQHLLQHLLLTGLRLYRGLVSPVLTALLGPLGFGCRFTPTCSHYASDAVLTHGPIAGSWLAARRLCRCHPWGQCGPDPVPSAPPRPVSSTPTSCRNGS